MAAPLALGFRLQPKDGARVAPLPTPPFQVTLLKGPSMFSFREYFRVLFGRGQTKRQRRAVRRARRNSSRLFLENLEARVTPSAMTINVSTVAQLRTAVITANTPANAGSTIVLAAGTYDLTTSGSGDLAFSQSVTIKSTAGAIIDAHNASRVIEMVAGTNPLTLTVSGLTLGTRRHG